MQLQTFLKIILNIFVVAKFDTGPCTVEIILRIAREEIYGPCELDVGTLVVKSVEALSTKSIVVEAKSWVYLRRFTSKIKSVMII